MNENDLSRPDKDQNQHDDELLVQRFVDGELSDEAQIEFLSRCEQRPESWRAVALAFVEQRVWNSELSALADDQNATCRTSAAAQAMRRLTPDRWPIITRNITAWAACLMLGLIVGWQATRWTSPRSPDRSSRVALETEKSKGASADQDAAGEPDSFDQNSDGQFVWLAFDSPNPAERQAIQVPVVHDSAQARGDLMAPPDLVREELVNDLRRAGIEVDQQRHILPVQLPDGRRMIVPVDQVKLRDVTYRGFQ